MTAESSVDESPHPADYVPNIEQVMDACRRRLSRDAGFECYAFNLDWYNEVVSHVFKLDKQYAHNSLAIVVLNTPRMFQASFKPWLIKQLGKQGDGYADRYSDPLDQYCKYTMKNVKDSVLKTFPGLHKFDVVHDFEILPSRRPKILLPTCGHVAGCCYYYQPVHVDYKVIKDSPDCSSYMGLSIHPVFGGWFAYRAVFIVPDVEASSLEKSEPEKLLPNDQIFYALTLFNAHWKDGRYRSVTKPNCKYDDEQIAYFNMPPEERWALIDEWLAEAEKSR